MKKESRFSKKRSWIASTSTSGSNKQLCVDCKTSKTPVWRSGPAGPKSLCNACGIRFSKKRSWIASTSTSGSNKQLCVDCKTSKTPVWRSGPAGPKSLCNACGIRFSKKRSRIASTSTLGSIELEGPCTLQNEIRRLQKEIATVQQKFEIISESLLTETRIRCKEQSETIRRLQEAVKEKVKISDLSSAETRIRYEEEKKAYLELNFRLWEANLKVIEGEALRKKRLQELCNLIRIRSGQILGS